MNKHKAILDLNPTVVNIVNADGLADVAYDKDGNVVAYDEAAVQALMASEAYKQQRAAEYPSIQAQLDTLYHGGYDAWRATIQAVKDKYPKG